MFRTPTTRGRVVRLGVAAALATSASIVLLQGVSGAAAATYIATPATGPAASAGYVITLAGTGFADASGTSLVHGGGAGVQFATACGTNETSAPGTSALFYNVVSATRLGVTAPSLALSSSTAASTAFKVCVYSKTSPFNLLGSGVYTIYPKPTVTKVAPAAGPTYGGNTIAVVGVNFTTRSTATVGGLPLTNVKVLGTTGLTGTVPAHAATPQAPATLAPLGVIVTTEAGPSAITAGTTDNYVYDYRAAISVSPVVGAVDSITGDGVPMVLTVRGSGFKALETVGFAGAGPKVYFIDGVFDPVAGLGVNDGVCSAVQVISDAELLCTTPALPGKAYTVTVVSDTTTTPLIQTALSSASTFTYAAF
jgi:hypothetical protein